ncbi:MAG: AIR synthase-related protein [Promethearchaeota archaeon]
MADLEGLTRQLLEKGFNKNYIIDKLVSEYLIYKNIEKEKAQILAEAVYEECIKSSKIPKDNFIKNLLKIPTSNVTIGKQGVGCRGAGDFYVHKIVSMFSKTKNPAFLSPVSLDDAGAVFLPQNFINKKIKIDNLIIVSKMEGMHSRLSDFPFIAGFHVTRAALRDLLVKGSYPISIMVDIHLGDDADVGKLFDFMAGVSAVSLLTNVPITAGSTLRIGGDMVIGTRITGGIAAIGVAHKLYARRNIKPGDIVLMTEGAGGGTIATTAIYSGNHEFVKETMNIKFLVAAMTLLNSELIQHVHCMCDVTNGGLRGDLYEINYEANVGVKVNIDIVKKLVNPNVLKLLEKTNVDYLGVSLDALLIYVEKEYADQIINLIKSKNIMVEKIGQTDTSKLIRFVNDKGESDVLPKFRESAYTKVKKVIGENTPEKIKQMESMIMNSFKSAVKKRDEIVQFIQNQT